MAIVVFGATGYTGRLVVAELVARGARPVLAGRQAHRLAEVAALHGGLPTAVADAAHPASVRELVAAGDVLVSTVGPFLRYGDAALTAAVDAGAHYVDSTGEAPFVRRVFAEASPRARAKGIVLLTAFGFDFVPGTLAGAMALQEAGGAATRLEVGYFFTGAARASSGTMATGVLLAVEQVHLRRDGRLVEVPFGRQSRLFVDGGRRRTAMLFGGTEPLTLPEAFPALTDVATYFAAPGRTAQLMELASYALPVVPHLPPARALMRKLGDRAVARTGEGPPAEQRERSGSLVLAVAADADGRPLHAVRLRGPDGYDVTARTMADAALRLAAGSVDGAGALGPVQVYGLDGLAGACEVAGLTRADG